jgi:uncharacterized protein Veg
MIKNTGSISSAKEAIERLKEKDVLVTVSLGRNRTVSFLGKLSGVYHALFTVTPDDQKFLGKTTYSYSEYLCGKVKIKEKKNLV